ncbi:hypothetical protein GUJ93_ZPchr0011g27538 [Zizania palustris]|uniref:Protein transport protein Sec24-like CEF n=1 Tax=Zizania palustris TaxID=103762 RepID=A0A8J5WLI6_ZIZPA|nr:hypothetical protein GUJ93_ZPchr0011g27538 [Zizania palustris]
MASPSPPQQQQPRPRPPFAAAQNPSSAPAPELSFPGAFSNLQISRGPAPPRGLTPQAGPTARPSGMSPPAARPYPGSPPPPGPPFARAPTASAAQSAPSFGGPPAVPAQPRPFGGSTGVFSQPPLPFGGQPGVMSQSTHPFGGPAAPVSQPTRPFGGPPVAVSQAPPPFGGPPAAVSQAPQFSVPPGVMSQPPLFGGPPALGSQPAPPQLGVPRLAFSGPPAETGLASSQSMPPSFGSQHQQAPPFGGPPQFGGLRPGAQSAPLSQQVPFMGPLRGNTQAFGPPLWQSQGAGSGAMQPPMRMPNVPTGMPPNALGQGMPPPTAPTIPYSPHAGTQVSTPSKIDPNQIPRPMAETSVIMFETRQGGQATIPPAASSEYIVKDTGNCSPRLMRCTVNQIPCTGDLLTTSAMPLSLMVQPFSLPHPSEEPIELVDFGDMGPIRCSRCKAYINPFMRFVDQGRHFICNLCGFSNDTPREYICNLGPDGRRRDADDRPELCRGTVEFVASKEFLVRDPMPAVYFFLIDVSMNAIQTGATAAACSAISRAISQLPEGPRTMVGIATFDSAIHFYSLKRAQQQPLMLIIPDIQDVYTPLQKDLILPVSECRENLEQLLENIPSMFENNTVVDSAFGAAMKVSV